MVQLRQQQQLSPSTAPADDYWQQIDWSSTWIIARTSTEGTVGQLAARWALPASLLSILVFNLCINPLWFSCHTFASTITSAFTGAPSALNLPNLVICASQFSSRTYSPDSSKFPFSSLHITHSPCLKRQLLGTVKYRRKGEKSRWPAREKKVRRPLHRATKMPFAWSPRWACSTESLYALLFFSSRPHFLTCFPHTGHRRINHRIRHFRLPQRRPREHRKRRTVTGRVDY